MVPKLYFWKYKAEEEDMEVPFCPVITFTYETSDCCQTQIRFNKLGVCAFPSRFILFKAIFTASH